MSESIESGATPSIEKLVKWVISSGRIGDTKNNFYPIKLYSGDPELSRETPRAATFFEYIKNKYHSRAGLAEAVLENMNPEFVTKFDEFANEVNLAIGDGIVTETQGEAVRAISEKAMEFIDKFAVTLPSEQGI